MPSLSLDTLNKTYGPVRALQDLSFAVRAGEIFGFVGSNGAGKSTAMRIALGVVAADFLPGHVGPAAGRCPVPAPFGYMPEERGSTPG